MIKRFVAGLIISCMLNIAVFQGTCYAASVNVKAGKQIPIVVTSKVTGKNTQSGEKIKAVVQNDIKINGVKVFKEGDTAYLNVADARTARFWGNPGEMLIVNGAVTDANGDIHRIEFNRKFIGEEKTYPKVMGAISIFLLFPLALFGFVKGGQAEILPSVPLNVTLADDFNFVQKL